MTDWRLFAIVGVGMLASFAIGALTTAGMASSIFSAVCR